VRHSNLFGMSDNRMSLSTPLVFFIFRRVQMTRQVFEVIAQAKPTHLLIIADGPRNSNEALQCAETRAIVEHIDWDCDVKRNYSETNLGLKQRFSSGLDWVFQQVEEAIILEDDCLPDPSFFGFCQEMLAFYRDEPRVMHISGDYFHAPFSIRESYYFSRYPHIWGWATWRRAWLNYDSDLNDWALESTQKDFLEQFPNPAERHFWKHTFDAVRAGTINMWDYQWVFACIANDGLSINPRVNLISNIGFGDEATHTKTVDRRVANLETQKLPFPITHPKALLPNKYLDAKTVKLFFSEPSRLRRMLSRIRTMIRSIVINS